MGLTNNDIFKKLRVAHKLRDEDIIKICALKDFKVSTSLVSYELTSSYLFHYRTQGLLETFYQP